MRRAFAIVSTAAAAALALSACSGGGDAKKDDKTADAKSGQQLVVWGDDTRAPVVKALGDEMKKKYGVDVKFVQKSGESLVQDWAKQVPAGQGPDLIVIAHDNLGAWVKDGTVGTVDLSNKKDDFIPVALDGVSYEGQTYGVPYAIENIAIVRNNKLTKADPKTFDEMIQAGKESGAKMPFVVQQDPTNGDAYHLYPFQTSFGAPVFKTGPKGYTSELAMGGENGHKFAEWLAKEGKEGILDVNITGDKAKQEFVNGNAAFTLTGPWNIPAFQEAGLDISVLPVPTAGGETAAPFVGIQAFFPNPKSKNPVLVNKFLTDVVASKDGQDAAYKAGKRSPAWKASAEAVDDPVVKGFTEAGKQGVPMPALPAMGAVWNYWGATEANIITGKQQPVAGWDQMVKNVEKAIADSAK